LVWPSFDLVWPASIFQPALIALMTEAVSTSETLDNFYETTWYNIPEGCHLQLPYLVAYSVSDLFLWGKRDYFVSFQEFYTMLFIKPWLIDQIYVL
jgi:hypothetical protein